MIVVIIKDFQRDRIIKILFDDNDFKNVELVWSNEDKLLADMQNNLFFTGMRRWCDLNIAHFRLMIICNLVHAMPLTDIEFNDLENTVVLSLRFLLASLIYCIQNKSECKIDTMKILRFDDNNALFDFSATLDNNFSVPKPIAAFRVIVDNKC